MAKCPSNRLARASCLQSPRVVNNVVWIYREIDLEDIIYRKCNQLGFNRGFLYFRLFDFQGLL